LISERLENQLRIKIKHLKSKLELSEVKAAKANENYIKTKLELDRCLDCIQELSVERDFSKDRAIYE
jgi:hypothetical protein